MRQFLLKIVLFGFLITSSAYGLDYMVQEGIKTTHYNQVTKWHEIIEGGISAAHLVVGSSRAMVHVDVDRLAEKSGKAGYNLGFNGFTYPHMKKTLELFLDRNAKPEKITWVIDYNTFESKESFYGFEQLIPFQKDPKAAAILNLASTNRWAYRIPLYRYSFNRALKFRGLLGYLELFKRKQVLQHGFLTQNPAWDGNFDSLKQQYPKGLSVGFEEELFRDFTALNQQLLDQQIAVEWVVAPYLEEYNQLLHNRIDLLDRLARTASKLNVPFYDYSSSEVSRSRDNFYNATHLNQQGVDWWMGELEKR